MSQLNGEAFAKALAAYDACPANNPPTSAGKILALRAALEAYESVRLAAAPASQQEARFKVIDESASAHCCFECTVVDTAKPYMPEHYADRYESVCETFDREDADMICAALNGTPPPPAMDSRAQRTTEGKPE